MSFCTSEVRSESCLTFLSRGVTPPPTSVTRMVQTDPLPQQKKSHWDESMENTLPLPRSRPGFVQTAKVSSPEERRPRGSCIKDGGESESGPGDESGGVNVINNKFPSAPRGRALCLIVLY